MPNERWREPPRPVRDVDDASVSRSRRRTRGMKEQGPESDDGTLRGEAYRLGLFGANAINRVSAQHGRDDGYH